MQTVICMKWGTRYGPNYVNRLWRMVKRLSKRDTRLVCFTDNGDGIDPAVQIEPIPHVNLPDHLKMLPWRKIALWNDELSYCLSGEVLFIDLDVVLTGNLDDFFDYEPGKFCVIENFTQRGKNIGNTTLYRFSIGKHGYIFDQLNKSPEKFTNMYRVSQQYISGEIDELTFWPREWCVSFKHDLLPRWPLNFFKMAALPKDAKLVAFTGKPDPDEAAIGKWPVRAAWKRLYKYTKPTPWIEENWR